ncbi:hypothetical protein SeLEV6574_g04841 [Synchytrium endobioticum]|uniref:RING-type domain-containing protein n=1 Tax=Synchytrium endobioticum TaxID=286115 RepID=A0A507CXR1_9FUNG|nr:hypothetical protein SeLEV6574_g04841 [Synchytrium endobioticum]
MPNWTTAASLVLILLAGLLQHTEAAGGCWGCIGPSRGADRSRSPVQTSRSRWAPQNPQHDRPMDIRNRLQRETFDQTDPHLGQWADDPSLQLGPSTLAFLDEMSERTTAAVPDYEEMLSLFERIRPQSAEHTALMRMAAARARTLFIGITCFNTSRHASRPRFNLMVSVNDDNEGSEECPICLGKLEFKKAGDVVELSQCSHSFHRKCINTWRKRNKSCPTCRESI